MEKFKKELTTEHAEITEEKVTTEDTEDTEGTENKEN